jgi:hypothetical protein
MTSVATSPLISERQRVLFVSYARADRDALRSLEHGLESLHNEVWIDRKLDGGQVWWDEILRRIRDCNAMVVAISPALLDSDAAGKERQYARLLGKPLLPVLIEPVLSDILPPDLAELQFVDYTSNSQLTAFQLASALMLLPPTAPLPDPLPPSPSVPVSYMTGLGARIRAESLSLDEQLNLVGELRRALERPRERQAGIELLRTLRARRDLFYTAGREADELLKLAESAVAKEPRQALSEVRASWHPDPSGRHRYRWFDGYWTNFVSDRGDDVQEDPLL